MTRQRAPLHISLVKTCDQILQVLFRAKPFVQMALICHPVTMIGISIDSSVTLVVLIDGRDPYCEEVE